MSLKTGELLKRINLQLFLSKTCHRPLSESSTSRPSRSSPLSTCNGHPLGFSSLPMAPLSAFFSSPYTLLPSSQDIQGFKSRAKAAPRSLWWFGGVQLALLLLFSFIFRSPPSPPPGSLGVSEWEGFDEVCGGKFGRYVCETYS